MMPRPSSPRRMKACVAPRSRSTDPTVPVTRTRASSCVLSNIEVNERGVRAGDPFVAVCLVADAFVGEVVVVADFGAETVFFEVGGFVTVGGVATGGGAWTVTMVGTMFAAPGVAVFVSDQSPVPGRYAQATPSSSSGVVVATISSTISTTGSGNVSSMTQRSHVPGVPKSAIPSSKPMDDVALIHASAETRTIVALGEDDPAGGALPSPARSTVTPFASTSSNASALFERLTVVVARLTATFSAAFSSVSG